MTDDQPVGPLPLLEALKIWCDQNRVMNARQSQQAFTVSALEAAGRPNLGQARRDDGRASPYRPTAFDERTQFNEAAWAKLLQDWRSRIEKDEIRLTGVQTMPEPSVDPKVIPGTWATDLEFDFINNAVTGVGQRHVAVQAWRGQIRLATRTSAPSYDELVDASRPRRPTLEAVRDLDPDVVAKLLELHAEHVCKDLGVNLNPPGKASVLALAAVKMKHRAKLDQLRPTISEEAEWLSHWCAGVAPSYQPLGDKTIRNKLGSLYRDLRSKAHR